MDEKDKHESNKQIISEHAYQHNVYVKKMIFPKGGNFYRGHHHNYDHVTLVAAGRVSVVFEAVPEVGLDAEEKQYNGGSLFVTRGFRQHKITALEDNTIVCCIHAIRDKDGEVITVFDNNKKETQAFAFTATPAVMNELLKKADQEGTLVQGSGDNLI